MKFNLLDLPLGYCGYNKDTGEFIITLTQADEAEKEKFKNMLISQGLEVRETGENQFTVKPSNRKSKNVHAENFIAPVDKLSKAILGCDDTLDSDAFMKTESDNADSWDSDAEGDLKKFSITQKLYVLVSLRYEDMPEDLQNKIANRRTRAVHDAMTSLILAGNKRITLQQIAGIMNGYSKKRQATEAFLKEIEHEADWLIHTWVKLDATNEANARGYNFKEVTFNRPLIPAGSVRVVNHVGQKVKAYEVWAVPVLYAYANQKHQADTVDIAFLALPDSVNTTLDNIILRNYLIEQIEAMSYGRIGTVILYETLYKVVGIQETSRQNKSKFRETVKAFLDNWVELGYIQGYTEEPKDKPRVAKERVIITPYMRKQDKKKLKG